MCKNLSIIVLTLVFCLFGQFCEAAALANEAAFANASAVQSQENHEVHETSAQSLLYPLFTKKHQISGTFAELRHTHFHAGVDYRTRQREGLRVRAVDEGVIYRIAKLEKGYGNVVYIKHPSGLVSVYAHLRKFSKRLEGICKDLETPFDIDISMLNIRLKKAEVFARSGNSGSSFGPHLHFELRSSSVDSLAELINPFLYGLTTKDNTAPNIKTIAFYPLGSQSLVNGKSQALYLEHLEPPYFLRGESQDEANFDSIYVKGNIYFGIEAIDSIEKLKFKYGLYSLCFSLNQDTLAYYKMDSLPLREIGLINSHIDQDFYRKNKRRIETTLGSSPKASAQNGSDSPRIPYKILKDGGILQVQSGKTYTLCIEASDFMGNTSTYKCLLIGL